jgi:FkbM family methyltransferase
MGDIDAAMEGGARDLEESIEAARGLDPAALAGAPSRFGRAGTLARRLLLRAARPVTYHQRELDAMLLEALGQVRDSLGSLERAIADLDGRLAGLERRTEEVAAGQELGTVPLRTTTYLGRPFLYPHDSTIGLVIDRGQQWDQAVREEVAELIREDEPLVCEVGANIGATLLQILAASPRAHVVALEPSTRFRPALLRNLELAGAEGVEVVPWAAGRRAGSGWLHRNTTTATLIDATRLAPGTTAIDEFERRGREPAQIVTLDELLADRPGLSFLKIDADGFDFEVLRGAEGVLERDRPVLHVEFAPVFSDDLEIEPRDDLAWLRSRGYERWYGLTPTGDRLGATADPDQVLAWAEEHTHCDLVACHRDSPVAARLEELRG